MAAIGDVLRAVRQQAGLSQAEASRRVGYKAPTTLNRIEQGKKNPTLGTLLKLAEIYGVEVGLGRERIDSLAEIPKK